MAEWLRLLVGTVALRPYVFFFLVVYLIAAAAHLGWRRALLFIPVGFWLAWLSEYCSIHWGFPYGDYFYIEATRNRELWIAGVPFMDSLSYVFLAYCSYSTALLLCAPCHFSRHGLWLLETRSLRRSWAVWVLASFLFVLLDIIIDPVALLGDRWFLGRIYGYREGGLYFGIPMSNFGGWLLVGFVLVGALQLLDRITILGPAESGRLRSIPFIDGLGAVLYLGVLIFNLGVTWWIGEAFQALVGGLLVFFPGLLGGLWLRYKTRYLPRQSWVDHIADFSHSPAARFFMQSDGRLKLVEQGPELRRRKAQ
jgi:uncharacterized membrane protein